jgi:hypothetical protein
VRRITFGKVGVAGILLTAALSSPPAHAWSVFVEFEPGVGGHLASRELGGNSGPAGVLAGALGMEFADSVDLSLEFQYWGMDTMFGSFVVRYCFTLGDDVPVRPVVLLGLGYGLAYHHDYYPPPDHSEVDSASGPVQLQVGGGVLWAPVDWFELGAELRLRFGFPSWPDVVSLSFLAIVRFHFFRSEWLD